MRMDECMNMHMLSTHLTIFYVDNEKRLHIFSGFMLFIHAIAKI